MAVVPDGDVVYETTDPLECNDDLEAGEPNTATLTCELLRRRRLRLRLRLFGQRL